jgi:hypothetical protein
MDAHEIPSDASVEYINGILSEMRQIRAGPGTETERGRKKGALGEKAAAAALRRYIAKNGGRLFHSVTFGYAKDAAGNEYPGNLNYKDGKLLETGSGGVNGDEVDLMLVTPRRIFLVECKAYRQPAGELRTTDYWTFRGTEPMPKCALCQAEKHARHFYHRFYGLLPGGNPRYVVPVLAWVDSAKFSDERSVADFPVTSLNGLGRTVSLLDKPLEYLIDVPGFVTALSSGLAAPLSEL